MSLSLTYTLNRRGWAEGALEVDSASVTLPASYLSDAFDDLVRATLSVVVNAADETVVFNDEPGQYRWKLKPAGQRLHITILAFDEAFARADDEAGRLIFEAECRLKTFAGAVLATAQSLLNGHGAEGYEALWGHHFPAAPASDLKGALASTKRTI